MSIEVLEAAQAMFDKDPEKFLSLRQAYKRRALADLTQPGIPDVVRAASLQLLVYPSRIKALRYVGKHPALAAPYGKAALQQIATEMQVADRIETAMKEIGDE